MEPPAMDWIGLDVRTIFKLGRAKRLKDESGEERKGTRNQALHPCSRAQGNHCTFARLYAFVWHLPLCTLCYGISIRMMQDQSFPQDQLWKKA